MIEAHTAVTFGAGELITSYVLPLQFFFDI
jgi:hypothetical protein